MKIPEEKKIDIVVKSLNVKKPFNLSRSNEYVSRFITFDSNVIYVVRDDIPIIHSQRNGDCY